MLPANLSALPPANVNADPARCLAGGGQMGTRMRAFDWSQTPLGPVESWPRSLQTTVSIVLGSRYPMFVWWGEERINLYNDAYIPVLGARHPAALALPGRELWPEIWDVLGPQVDAVFQRGEATWNEDVLLIMERRGFPEETYFTWSYSPVLGNDGAIAGMFCACSEETAGVLSQRRLRTLRELATACAGADNVEATCAATVRSLAASAYDIPFALLYLLQADGKMSRLAVAAGLESGVPGAPAEISLGQTSQVSWPLARALAEPQGMLVDLQAAGFPALPGGPWPEAARQALVLPLASGWQSAPTGFLVAGVSPRLVLDEEYRNLFTLLADTIATALNRTRADEARRENEGRHALFARLYETIRPLRDPEEIVRAVTSVAGEHFAADRCSYSEVNAATTHATVLPDWMRGDLPSIAGVHDLDSYGPVMMAAMRAGENIIIPDMETYALTATPTARAAWQAIDTRGILIVPLLKEGRLAATFFLLTHEPRNWTPTEVTLAEQVAEQTWSALAAARAAEALRVNEERNRRQIIEQQAIYDTALSTIPDFTYIFDLEGRFAYANRALLGMFGLSAEEVVGKNFYELHYAPEIADRLTRHVQQVIATKESLRDETPYTNAAGRGGLFEYIFTPTFNEAGEVTAVVGITRDITARNEAEQIMRASRDQFQQLADSAPAMLWITEPDGACTFLSRSWYEFTGQTEPEGYGLGWTKAIHPDECEAAGRAFMAANAARTFYQVDFRVRRADGEYRWVVDAGRPRFDQEGVFLGFIGSVIDIHERKAAEAALEERAATLREADRRKDEFLAMLAHELRNPLASVTNAVTLLRETESEESRDAGAAEQESNPATENAAGIRSWATDVIARQSNQLARLVDDLLDVSRITRGNVSLRRERVDATHALGSACEAVAPQVAERKHTLLFEVPREALWLDADPTRLEQIVVNLLSNAARYTEPKGTIWLEAFREEEAEEQSAAIVISVRDSGIGIAPEKIPEMFELFAQGERSAARSEGGLGIGLTVVRGLCNLHGGSVSAHSDGPGTGTAFTVRLPAAAAPAAVDGRDSSMASASRTGARILVVDDNVDTAQGLGRLLRRRGYTVEVVHDGASALEKAHAICPAAVLLDIGLPGMDGYEVAKHLREQAGCAATAVIAISGYGQEEDRARSRAAGFDHHLVKPVDFEELRVLLAKQLSERERTSALP